MPNDTKDKVIVEERIEIGPSTLETIDYAIATWVDEVVNPFCNTNEGWKKVPVTWTASERSHQIKAKRSTYDIHQSLILPVLSIDRTAVTKDLSRKGTAWANVPPINDYRKGSLTVARRINQDKTANFANADTYREFGQLNFRTRRENKKIVYQTLIIPMPVYVTVNYKISIKTSYQQQMNEIVEPFMNVGGGINYFTMAYEKHSYEGFVQQDFTQSNVVANLNLDERIYQTDIEIKVLGHLIGDGPNKETPHIIVRESAVEVKMPRERVILGDENPFLKKNKKYRP
jgi:hypothetical protein